MWVFQFGQDTWALVSAMNYHTQFTIPLCLPNSVDTLPFVILYAFVLATYCFIHKQDFFFFFPGSNTVGITRVSELSQFTCKMSF